MTTSRLLLSGTTTAAVKSESFESKDAAPESKAKPAASKKRKRSESSNTKATTIPKVKRLRKATKGSPASERDIKIESEEGNYKNFYYYDKFCEHAQKSLYAKNRTLQFPVKHLKFFEKNKKIYLTHEIEKDPTSQTYKNMIEEWKNKLTLAKKGNPKRNNNGAGSGSNGAGGSRSSGLQDLAPEAASEAVAIAVASARSQAQSQGIETAFETALQQLPSILDELNTFPLPSLEFTTPQFIVPHLPQPPSQPAATAPQQHSTAKILNWFEVPLSQLLDEDKNRFKETKQQETASTMPTDQDCEGLQEIDFLTPDAQQLADEADKLFEGESSQAFAELRTKLGFG